MRVLALLLAILFLSGCASKPAYYISPTPVQIPATATYWIDNFDLELVGKNERFMPQDALREQLSVELINQLSSANRYATSKESADYLLDVNTVYKRRIGNSNGGLVSVIVDDNTILASVDFSYQVKVKKAGTEVLHFSHEREGLQPAGAFGQLRNMKSMVAALTHKDNADVEPFYIRTLPTFIVSDIRDIPSR
ncbi:MULTISPECIES: hypothetical protein [unclassified Pseudomonas]|uniref:hypothetical protein n=1 Tax=unclassified Pseudomonas TaxID=196821 RepID=UPI000CD149AC|nr:MULTISPECIES: hypothetical protein [unclassified Pseudomonas]POA31409.1 hypothetical protein C1887_13510 [Pseudomonas sp. GW456-R21]POA63101.1 hypothetical protein C1884_25410 [Pseudomonas sp. GW460-R15]